MAKQSAGLLFYRVHNKITEFFLVHPGGPFFSKKEAGWWTIPKGELQNDELPLDAAIREFREETGTSVDGDFIPLSPIVQKGGKKVFCWAVEGNIDTTKVVSNTFEMLWPPRSGLMKVFPEVDKCGWFTLIEAKQLINEKQAAFLDELIGILKK